MLASTGVSEKYRHLIAQYNQNLSRRDYTKQIVDIRVINGTLYIETR